MQEAKDIDVSELLPTGWRSYQDTSSEAKAGSCVAVRTDALTVARAWLVKGCGAAPDGGMMPRWLACADVTTDDGDRFTAISAHAPPPRYSSMQPGFNANLAAVCNNNPHPLVGADANQDIDRFARALGNGMRAVGKQSGICLVSADPLTAVLVDGWAEDNGASDHPCVWATLELATVPA